MGLEQLKASLRCGNLSRTDWQRLRQSAAGAPTRFRPAEQGHVPAKAEVDYDFYLPSHGWSMLGGDTFEDERRLDNAGHGQGRSRSGNRGVSQNAKEPWHSVSAVPGAGACP